MSIFNPLSFISFPSFLASRVGIKLVSFGSSMLHAAYANHVGMCMLWIHCSVAFLWCTCAPLLPLTADSALLITVMLPCACRAACRFPCGHGWKAVRLAGGWQCHRGIHRVKGAVICIYQGLSRERLGHQHWESSSACPSGQSRALCEWALIMCFK